MEAVMLICDRGDGRPATESIRFKLGNRSLQLDLCDRHLREFAQGAHPVKRGRQRGTSGNAAKARTKTRSAKTTGAKRRGRPPGSKNKTKS